MLFRSRSVAQAVLAASADRAFDVIICSKPDLVRKADRVVLPGQGAMPDCMRELRDSGLLESVLEAAQRKPMFGVCVGMQMLLDHSAEGDTPGLGLIPGEVLRFDLAGRQQADGSRYKVPQMGWNQVWQTGGDQKAHPMWNGIPDGSSFYFVHSFYASALKNEHIVGITEYGAEFVSAVARENVCAVQFHPEKSHRQGLQLLENFLVWDPDS